MPEVSPEEKAKAAAAELAKRLEAAVKSRAERAEREKARDAERLILLAELEDKCSRDYGEDQRNSFWQVKDLGPHGVLALHRVDLLVVAAWDDAVAKHAKEGTSITTDEQLNFVEKALIYPKPEEFRKMVQGTPGRPGAEGLAAVATFELRQLHGHYAGQLLGKS